MLGDLVYEGRGKVVAMRRLPNGKYELTGILRGKFQGKDFSYEYKAEVETKRDGTERIEFNGASTIENEMLPFSGIGNGTRREDGSVVYRGAASYSSPPGEYAWLNGILLVVEAEVDAGGVVNSKAWEWK